MTKGHVADLCPGHPRTRERGFACNGTKLNRWDFCEGTAKGTDCGACSAQNYNARHVMSPEVSVPLCVNSMRCQSERPVIPSYRSFAIGHPDCFHLGGSCQKLTPFGCGPKPVVCQLVIDPCAFQISRTGGFDLRRQV